MTKKKKANMAKGPKAASKAKGPPKFAPRGPRTGQGSSFTPFAPSPHKPSAFTLADEAQHTARNPSSWNSDQKLRSKQIVFVSAGHLHGEQPKGIEDTPDEDEGEEAPGDDLIASPNIAMAKMTLQSDTSSSPNTPHSQPGIETPVDDSYTPMAEPPSASFFVDTSGAQAVTGLPPPVVRSPSPTPSDSSEEVVLFKGRNNIQRSIPTSSPVPSNNAGRTSIPASSAPASAPISSTGKEKQPVEDPLSQLEMLLSKPVVAQPVPPPEPLMHELADRPSPARAPPTELKATQLDDSRKEAPSLPLRNHVQDELSWDKGATRWAHKSTRGVGWLEDRSRRPKRVYEPNAADREALEDYLDNIRRQEQLGEFELPENTAFGQRTLSLEDGNDWEPEQSTKVVEEANVRETTSISFVRETASIEVNKSSDQDEWDSVMLDDFEYQSTSSDVEGVIERILAKRTRKNGTQYLVVYEGWVTDDAKWLPATFLTSEGDVALLWAFEAKLQEKEELQRQAMESSDSELTSSDNDDEDEDEDFEDEKDLIARRLERMSDEKIARRLAKQEELGLGSEELFLFGDDDAMDSDSELEDEEKWLKKKGFASASSFGRSRQKAKRARGDYPSASLMADVVEQDPYNGFDVMDTERPSLKKKAKGRRGQPPPEVSDSDMEAQMRATWEADRRKKSEYKKEREERRAQGLLGKKNTNKADLAIKYREGFTMAEILEEIREFLISDHTSYAMPPMEAHERAHIHNFARKLNLATKSVGAGQNRFINISKNTRTRAYNEREFNSVVFRLRYFAQSGKAPREKTSKTKAAARPVYSYRDGEVVGASAPELGADNRGHALLQKMGWSKGMALGALDNKGILQPITHTVKSGKAGLK